MSTGNMCIFYTFVPFYKFKMQYLYSFTKSFFIIDHAKAPIRVFLCCFSHYMVYQICFRNTYCVTDDIRYATIGQDCGSAQHGTILQVSTPGTPERENAGAFYAPAFSHTSSFYISVFKTVVPRCTSRTGNTIFWGTGSFFRLFVIYSTHNSAISSTG